MCCDATHVHQATQRQAVKGRVLMIALQDVFRMRVKRKVHPKTATVEVDGVFFQCETFLRGR
jgi:hypothetical protein